MDTAQEATAQRIDASVVGGARWAVGGADDVVMETIGAADNVADSGRYFVIAGER